jgi:APA family basic amino acid/polyamine antiporter
MSTAATSGEPRADPPRLIRAIGRWSLTAAIVNGVIGSSIFGMPAQIAELVGPGSPLAFLLAGLGILLVVLCFAEVSSRFTEAGGPYLYARDAFGRDVGFQAGWLTFWIRATATAANLNVFAAYLGELVPGAAAGAGRLAVMAVVLAIITAINVRGVRQATWTVNGFTIAKLTPLLLLIVLGLPHVTRETLASQTVARADWAGAILLLVFAYGGFEAPLMAAGEARQPRRDSAFALLVGLAAIATVYMLVQMVIVGVLPNVAGTRAPVATAFGALLGPGGIVLGSLGAMISVYGYTTGSVLQSPRLLYAMADNGELPRLLARVHPHFRTPHVAIAAFAALTLALASYGSFTWNATLSAIVRLVTYGLTCVALLVFRRRSDAGEPGFRLPGAWLIAPAGALFCLGLLLTRTFAQAWILAALMAVGWVLGRAARRPGQR